MTDRRRELDRALMQQPAMQRIAQRLDEGMSAIADRMEAGFDRIDGRISRMERDLSQGELDQVRAQNEMAEIRRDIGDLRDAFGLAEGRRVEGAAKGAAAGAVEAVKSTTGSFWKTKWGALVAFAIGFTALVTFFEKLPKAARGINDAWAYVMQRDAAAPVARKDPVDGK